MPKGHFRLGPGYTRVCFYHLTMFLSHSTERRNENLLAHNYVEVGGQGPLYKLFYLISKASVPCSRTKNEEAVDDRLRLREVRARVWEVFDMTEPIWQCVEHHLAEYPISTQSTNYNTLMLSLAFPIFLLNSSKLLHRSQLTAQNVPVVS